MLQCFQRKRMGNNNAIVMSTCSNIFIVTFNQSDILYWLYRDLYEVTQNRPIMVSGIMAAGSVKVGVIYYKKNDTCTYDLFRVGHGAVLTIKVNRLCHFLLSRYIFC